MRFVELLLVNIRSYTKQRILFPEGRVLLAGDIGSGKSTILLAIEFALFGIIRGAIKPSSVLRHGAQTGLVELVFELGQKTYTIRRVLKQTNSVVEQESGYLLSDGQKKEGTATELKTWILELLGYPVDVAGKSTTLLYRYTVYTPQEEMKHILFDGAESRLSVLRKIFDIEKYKTMGMNAQVYARVLRERKRVIEGQVGDLFTQTSRWDGLKKEAEAVQKEIITQKMRVEELQKNTCSKEEELRLREEGVRVFLQKKQDLAVKSQECSLQQQLLQGYVNDRKRFQEQILVLEKEIQEMQSSIPKIPYEQEMNSVMELEKRLHSKEEELRIHEKNVRIFLQKKQDLAVKDQEQTVQQKMLDEYTNESKKFQEELAVLGKEIQEVQMFTTQTSCEQEMNLLAELERKYVKQKEDIAQLNALQEEHTRVRAEVTNLDFCPLCQQQVSHEHKNSIITKKNSVLQELAERVKQSTEDQEKFHKAVSEKKKEVDKQRELQQTLSMKEKYVQERKQQKEVSEQKRDDLSRLIKQNETEVRQLEQEVKGMQESEQILETAKNDFKELGEVVSEKKKEINKRRELEQILLMKKNYFEEKKQQKETIDKKSEEVLLLVQQNEIAVHQLAQEVKSSQDKEQLWDAARKNLREVQEVLNAQVVVLHRFLEKQQMLEKHVKDVAGEVEKKQRLKQKKELLEKKEQWLSEHFVALTNNMERAVFARVWNELNTYFVQWFQLLIEEEGLHARLDESCSPIIEQNGYETFIEDLSGGEKTSCALAYRLALNKVINDLMVRLQTKDVLILDEPTDGFSTEQLDRLKEVLDALDARQVILESHEKKVEGFVDHVIRIGKTNHASYIDGRESA